MKNHKCKNCTKIVVFTDLRMPQMDGIELCKELKKIEFNCHLKIVLITAEESSIYNNLFDAT